MITAGRADTESASRPRTIDQVLESARRRIARLTSLQAEQAWADAVLVDIRPAAQREAEGLVPGALIIERNVLEWPFDPSSDARLPIADYDLQVIVVCQEGYTSSLAAAALQDVGIHRVTDVIGGYVAWRELVSCIRSPLTVGVVQVDACRREATRGVDTQGRGGVP